MNADRIAIMISSCVGHARCGWPSTNWDLRAEWPNETAPGPRGNDGTNPALSASVWSGRGHSGTVRYLKKTVDQEVRGSAVALERLQLSQRPLKLLSLERLCVRVRCARRRKVACLRAMLASLPNMPGRRGWLGAGAPLTGAHGHS